MTLPAHAAAWMDRAEIDYIGPFVKAWAAFNAWYRHASGQRQERDMLDYVKNAPNPARRGLLPLLRGDADTAAASSLRQAVYDLHQCLDAIDFEITRKGVRERISLRAVCINPRHWQAERLARNRQEYRAARIQGGHIEITVRSLQTQRVRFQHTQAEYNPAELYGQRGFVEDLSDAQRTTLRQFYDGCNPRPMRDLLRGDEGPLTIGPAEFRCSPDDLLCGLVEILYSMRNALLHGEVDPDAQVLSCYEPAYRVVMRFLATVR